MAEEISIEWLMQEWGKQVDRLENDKMVDLLEFKSQQSERIRAFLRSEAKLLKEEVDQKSLLSITEQPNCQQREQAKRDCLHFSCATTRGKRRRKSMTDQFKEYKSRLDYKLMKIPTDFNIIYCSCPYRDHTYLLGIKNKDKRFDLVSLDIRQGTFQKLMSVRLIIDMIAIGELIIMAERNENIKVFMKGVLLTTLGQRFQAQYFTNAYGNDSRILHRYNTERVFYITENNKIAQYSLNRQFKEQILEFTKSSYLECLAVHSDSLYAVTNDGWLFKYCLISDTLVSQAELPNKEYNYCTVVGFDSQLLVSGLSVAKKTNILLLMTAGLEVIQELPFSGMTYPFHKLLPFKYFGVTNIALLYKDVNSSIQLFGLSNGLLRKLNEIKLSSSMLYDVFFHEDSIVCCGWEDTCVIQKVRFKMITLD